MCFCLRGRATNMASMTVRVAAPGNRAVAIYRASIAGCSVLLGRAADQEYAAMETASSVLNRRPLMPEHVYPSRNRSRPQKI